MGFYLNHTLALQDVVDVRIFGSHGVAVAVKSPVVKVGRQVQQHGNEVNIQYHELAK
jgi:hypothetical protein